MISENICRIGVSEYIGPYKSIGSQDIKSLPLMRIQVNTANRYMITLLELVW
jgi:hypothetical protein